MTSLEQRLTIAEATLAITRLKACYASLADAKYTDDHRNKAAATNRPQEAGRKEPAEERDDGATATGRWLHCLLITPEDTRTPIHAMGFTEVPLMARAEPAEPAPRLSAARTPD